MILTKEYIKKQIKLLKEQRTGRAGVFTSARAEAAMVARARIVSDGAYTGDQNRMPVYLRGLNTTQQSNLLRVVIQGAGSVQPKGQGARFVALHQYLQGKNLRVPRSAGRPPNWGDLRVNSAVWGGDDAGSSKIDSMSNWLRNLTPNTTTVDPAVAVALHQMGLGRQGQPAGTISRLTMPSTRHFQPIGPTPNTGCQSNADCQRGQICVGGQCRQGGVIPPPPPPQASGDPYELEYKCIADDKNRLNAIFSMSIEVEPIDRNVMSNATLLQKKINMAGSQQFGGTNEMGGADDSLLDEIFGPIDLNTLKLSDGGRELIMAAMFQLGRKPGAGPSEGAVNLFQSPSAEHAKQSSGRTTQTRGAAKFTTVNKIAKALADHNVFQSQGVFTNTLGGDIEQKDDHKDPTKSKKYQFAAKRIYAYLTNPEAFYRRRYAANVPDMPLYLRFYRSHQGSDRTKSRDLRYSNRQAGLRGGASSQSAHIVTVTATISKPPVTNYNTNVRNRRMPGPYDLTTIKYERSDLFEAFAREHQEQNSNLSNVTALNMRDKTRIVWDVARRNIIQKLNNMQAQVDRVMFDQGNRQVLGNERFGGQEPGALIDRGGWDPTNPNQRSNITQAGASSNVVVQSDLHAHNIWHNDRFIKVMIEGRRVPNGSKIFTLYDDRDKVRYKNPGAKCRMESEGVTSIGNQTGQRRRPGGVITNNTPGGGTTYGPAVGGGPQAGSGQPYPRQRFSQYRAAPPPQPNNTRGPFRPGGR